MIYFETWRVDMDPAELLGPKSFWRLILLYPRISMFPRI